MPSLEEHLKDYNKKEALSTADAKRMGTVMADDTPFVRSAAGVKILSSFSTSFL